MKITSSTGKFLNRALLISSLVVLPACKPLEWIKDKLGSQKPKEEVVVSFNNKPIVTGAEFEKNIQLLMQAQPAFQQMLPLMNAEQQVQIYNQIAETMAAERMMTEWVKKAGLDKNAEYKANAQQIHEAVDRDLAVRAFQNELVKQITITDEEAENYYRENGDKNPAFKRAPFTAMMGGVKAQGVSFATDKEAKDFAALAKKSDFAKAAQQAKKSVTDFGVVTSQTIAVDNKIKSTILDMKKFPSTEVVKSADGKFWVVQGLEQPTDFASIKENVKEVMMGEKFNELYTKKMGELKSEFNVVVNKNYIMQHAKSTAPQMEEPAQEEADQKNDMNKVKHVA